MGTTEKINYYDLSLEKVREIKAKYGEEKPKLLVHVCCGACSCFPLLFLIDLFDVTVYFSNSNIYPYEEFMRRLEALKSYSSYLNEKFSQNIKIIVDDYDHESFLPFLTPLKDEKEGGKRCEVCIFKRIERTFLYAKENNFNFVTTVMSVSPNKNVNMINKIGEELMKKYEVEFIPFDFKKNDGQLIGNKISKKLGVYRQCYCGCEYSIYE